MKYYVIPDIHGMSSLLQKALNVIYKSNESGKIIFLGDYIDRGPDNLGVINTVMHPPEKWEFVCLMGNHEDMFLEAYRNESPFYDITAAYDLAGIHRGSDIENIHSKIDLEIVDWMQRLKHFHIEDKNVFVHAYYDDQFLPEEQSLQTLLWRRMYDSEPYENFRQGYYLTHGHTPRSYGPIKSQNRLNLDCGAVFDNRLVIAIFEQGKQGAVDFIEVS